jgi:hypothetical protein
MEEHFLIGGIVGFSLGIAFGLVCAASAYFNGCCDGYGYSKEPDCPGYRKAGEYLRKHMAHRWSELDQEVE